MSSEKNALSTSSASIPRPKTLLYVDDDEGNCDVASLRLGASCVVIIARTDREACELLRTRGHKFDVILLDVQLIGSDLDGLQLARLIRGQASGANLPEFARSVPLLMRTPIVLVTAYGSRFPPGEIEAAGCDAVINKPIDVEKLKRAIEQAAAKRGRCPS